MLKQQEKELSQTSEINGIIYQLQSFATGYINDVQIATVKRRAINQPSKSSQILIGCL